MVVNVVQFHVTGIQMYSNSVIPSPWDIVQKYPALWTFSSCIFRDASAVTFACLSLIDH